ncbi:Chromosome transmission fidelity protein 18 [Nymphon striatum]|nr:Chromosome transmission fidelity protein 18 [Nymphon striatum]
MDEYDEIDFFESQYADELNALNELDVEPEITCKKYPASKASDSSVNDVSTKCPDSSSVPDSSIKKRSADEIDLDTTIQSIEEASESGIKQNIIEPVVKRKRIDTEEDSLNENSTEQIYDRHVSSFDSKVLNQGDGCVYRRIPNGKFLRVTSQDGVRAYLKLKPKKDYTSEVTDKYSSRKASHMLSQPYHELYAEIQEQSMKNTEMLAKTASEAKRNLLSNSDKLWVEEYKPQNYINLLSDDGTNRTLLQWLKLWDKVVFNKEKRIRSKPSQTDDLKKPGFQNGINPKFKKLSNKYLPEIIQELDSHNRPMQKMGLWLCSAMKYYYKYTIICEYLNEKYGISEFCSLEVESLLTNVPVQDTIDIIISKVYDHETFSAPVTLLSGPPGLGKTTLAHVIAKHAGYSVVEMNASDDRSIDVFRNRIEAATQMKSVLGKDPRPNCLIIDEIDGAPTNSINLLIQLTKSTGATTGKRKKKSGFLLNRPIICICNDQFVPALRPLRAISLIINFPPTIASRLATRLYEVVRNEKMMADINMLYALCEKANNDIRSCLSTLQFIRCKKKNLTMADILSSSVGQKDEHRSLFAVWQEIFTVPRQQKKSFINPHDLNDKTISNLSNKNVEESAKKLLTSQSINLLKHCYSCGETPRLIHGMFENYLNMKFKDSRMSKVFNGTEWLCFSDLINQEIMHSQNYILMPYLPYTCVAYHFMYSVLNPPRIIYPTMDSEHKTNHTKMVNMITALYSEMPSHVRSFISERTLVQDMLPSLIDIIQPRLRPINTQLYSNHEKEELQRLISIMISYNLTYRQERTEDGQIVFTLDPNVEELISFSGIKLHNSLTYTMRQLVAREIDLEKMRRSEPIKIETKKPEKVPVKSNNHQKAPETVIPNHKQVLQAKSFTETGIRPELDFFGRVVERKKTADSSGK